MIKNKPLVSISCVTYNHEPYIRECLDGFLMQKTDFDFEILIHDDASTDNTATIIREYELIYPEIINPIYQTENQYSKGVRPINKFNFERAQGKYIALCEGDDYWTDPLKLQKQVDFLEENEDYVLTGHHRNTIDENGNVIKKNKKSEVIHTQCMLFKNVLKEDFLDNNIPILNGDTFLTLYLENFGKSKILDFNGSNYRVSDVGIWSTLEKSIKNQITKDSYNKMLLFFQNNNYNNSAKKIEGWIADLTINDLRRGEKVSFIQKTETAFQLIKIKDFNRLKSLILYFFK